MKQHAGIILVLSLFYSSLVLAQANQGLRLYGPCMPTESACPSFTNDDGTTFIASPMDRVALTIKDAHMSETDDSFNVILDAESAKSFEIFTGAHIGLTIGLVFNDKLLSAPKVMEAIKGGEFMISDPLSHRNSALCKEIFAACKEYQVPSVLQRVFDWVMGYKELFNKSPY